MTAYEKQDSNSTALALALELSRGVVDGTAVWISQEPNSYKNFGASYKLTARNPINASRQANKGVQTDLTVGGDWQTDLTYVNTQDWIEGVLFADFRRKAELAVPVVANTASSYEPVSGGAAFKAGDLLFAKGFTQAINNGLKNVVSGASGAVDVSQTTADESGSAGIISRVGFQFASGDLTYDTTGARPALLSTAKSFLELGIIAGEWIYVGGDLTANKFTTAANNGYARVYNVAAHRMDLDKVQSQSPATDAGTGKTVQIFCGRFIKNESDPSLIKRRTYNIERMLNKSASDSSYQQVEYLSGSVLDTHVITFNSADKVTYDLTALAGAYEVRNSAVGPKAGTRPALGPEGAYSTTGDLVRCALSIVGTASPLFARLTDMAITINNNAVINKALGTFGGFDVTAGEFVVNAAGNAYFATTDALDAIRLNDDVTFDAIVARGNQGIAYDMPLGALSSSGLKVSANQPVTLPITLTGSRGRDVNANADLTLSVTYFDYLPNAAMGA